MEKNASLKLRLIIGLIGVLSALNYGYGQERNTLKADELTDEFLATVATQFEDHKIIMLGEPTHGAGNIFEIKTQLLKKIIEKNSHTVIAFESGLYNLWRAEKLPLGNQTPIPSLKDGIFTIWSCSKEMENFFSLLAKWGDKVTVAGFDCQFSGTDAAENIQDDFTSILNASKITFDSAKMEYWGDACVEMAESFSFPDDFSLTEFLSTSDYFIKKCEKYPDNFDLKFWAQILKSTKALATDYFYNAPAKITKANWRAEKSNPRDKQMADNLLFLHNQFKDVQIVCWGASAHLAKGFSGIENDELKSYIPAGQILAGSIGNENIFSLAFTGISGSHGIASDTVYTLSPPESGSIEQIFSDKAYSFLKLNENRDTFNCRALEFTSVRGNWSGAFDALLCIRSIYPNHIDCFPSLSVEDRPKMQGNITPPSNQNLNSAEREVEYITVSQSGEERIEGRIVDTNGTPIPFASLIYKNVGIGALADEKGFFTLFKSTQEDTLIISSIGYKAKSISTKSLKSITNIVKLEVAVNVLKEVTVTSERLSALTILKNVIKRFNSNYIQTPYNYQLKLSRTAKSKTGQMLLVENYLSQRDKNGYQYYSPYPIRNEIESELVKSRGFYIDTLTFDTIPTEKTYKIVAGIGLMNLLNYRKNTFLNKKKWRHYDFELSEVIPSEDSEIYKITFRCNKLTHFNTLELSPLSFWGEVFVLSTDFAVLKINTYATVDKTKIWRAEKYEAYKTEHTWYSQETVTYKKIGNYYFLDEGTHVTNWEDPGAIVKIKNLHVGF